MSDDVKTADNSLKLIGSSTVNYAVILTLGGCLLSAVWYSAHKDAAFDTLTATVAAQNAALNQRITDGDAASNLRISRIADSVMERVAVLEKRNEAQGALIIELGNRLTRIESKLDFLTQTVAPRK